MHLAEQDRMSNSIPHDRPAPVPPNPSEAAFLEEARAELLSWFEELGRPVQQLCAKLQAGAIADALLQRSRSWFLVSVREQTESFESVSGLPLKSLNLL